MKSTNKILSFCLALLLLAALAAPAFAANETPVDETISFLCYNVAGLPIPSAFSPTKKVVPTATKKIGQVLNDCGCDVIAVQEDFQFHGILARQMTNYPYQTFTSGGIPVGDGLNIFSKYPLYNVERVAWNEAYGIFTQGADELTPKGFIKCTVDYKGLLFDFYNIHVDAYGSEIDCAYKVKQFNQLLDYITENSAGRSVMITGDYNAIMHSDVNARLYPILIEGGGFKDAWCEVVNDGDYFQGDDKYERINYYTSLYQDYWGYWDSVERMLYRDGDLHLTALTNEYELYVDENGSPLSDHASCRFDFTFTAERYARPEMELKEPQREPVFKTVSRVIHYVFHSLSLILGNLWNWAVHGEYR